MFRMPNDLVPNARVEERLTGLGAASSPARGANAGSQSAELAASDPLLTGFAPPFRALLDAPSVAVTKPAVPEPKQRMGDCEILEWSQMATRPGQADDLSRRATSMDLPAV